MRSIQIQTCLLTIIIALSCSSTGNDNPVEPGIDQSSSMTFSQDGIHGQSSRGILGIWGVSVSSDHQSVEVIPLRLTSMHLNATQLLENQPFSECLKIDNLQIISLDEISVDITLWHPFPGNYNLTAFDVRGIFMSDGNFTFPSNGKTVAWGDDVLRMLNPDGYTSLFNPTDFPEDLSVHPAFSYFAGEYATQGDLSATLNPFIAFAKDEPRRMFGPGSVETKTIRLRVPDGPLEFGYAVDLSWKDVPGGVTDPLEDFPPNANCAEAYRIEYELAPGYDNQYYDTERIYAKIWDHQGVDTIPKVTVEIPDVFEGEHQLWHIDDLEDGCHLFGSNMIANELGADKGIYPMLIRVDDVESSPNLGWIDAWLVGEFRIKDGWVQDWGGEGTIYIRDMVINDAGNIYITGSYKGLIDFKPGPLTWEVNSAMGSEDAFLAMYTNTGSLLFVIRLGGNGWDAGYSVDIDNMGNVYVAGMFGATVDFDPGPDEEIQYAGLDRNAFLVKFDSLGEFQWVDTWGGEYPDYAYGVEVIGDEVFVTGSVRSHHASSVFLAWYHTDGQLEKFITWGGDHYNTGYALTTDTAGNIYVAGTFSDTVDFDPGLGEEEHTSNGYKDCFISKFDPDCKFIWARTWGSEWTDDFCFSIKTDIDGNICVAGIFEYTVDFDPDPVAIDEHTSNGDYDAFLSKFNTDGDFQWARTWGWEDYDGASDLFIGNSGEIVVTGSFNDSVDFDPGSGEDIHSAEGTSAYVSKFDVDGWFQWADTWGGDLYSRTYGNEVSLNSSDNIYVSGSYWGDIDFDPGPGTDLRSSGEDSGAYISMFPPDGNW